MKTAENFLWVEKYRPQTISDCILTDSLSKLFRGIVESGELQNLLLCGGPGCGKTTVAKALCDEIQTDWILINCSEDGNIDTLRTKIRNFASTVSLSGNRKAVILDEFDYSNPQSMQPALRGFMEEFSTNCRFIMTCNYHNKIIEPLRSRCTNIKFNVTSDEKVKIGIKFLERIKYILDEESVQYDPKVLVRYIIKYSPDFRRVINELQRYAVGGKIDAGILLESGDLLIEQLFKSMKEKNFTDVRKWVASHIHNDPAHIFNKLYTALPEYLDPKSVPVAILTIADYQYKSAFVADQEINTTACILHLMMECECK